MDPLIRSLWRRVKKDIDVIRSVWRPILKKEIKVRDLEPVRDVKAGGGVTRQSKSVRGGTASSDTISTWLYVPKKTNPSRGAED